MNKVHEKVWTKSKLHKVALNDRDRLHGDNVCHKERRFQRHFLKLSRDYVPANYKEDLTESDLRTAALLKSVRPLVQELDYWKSLALSIEGNLPQVLKHLRRIRKNLAKGKNWLRFKYLELRTSSHINDVRAFAIVRDYR